MSKEDPFGKLSDEWFKQALSAEKWKGKFACCNELYDIVENIKEGTKISSGKKTEKGVGYLVSWLADERHLFTRIKILQIFQKILPGLDSKIFEKKHSKCAAGLVKQWMEKKANPYVTSLLLILWNKHGDITKWGESITYILQTTNPITRGAWWSFLCLAGELNPQKAKEEYNKKLLKSGDVLDAAITDVDNRNNDTKKAAIKFLAVVKIFQIKEKEKKHLKKIVAVMDKEEKIKKEIEELIPTIKSVMKKNAKKNAPKKKAPAAGGADADDQKTAPTGKKKRGRSKSPRPKGKKTAGGGGGAQVMVQAVSKEVIEELQQKIDELSDNIQMLKMQFSEAKKLMDMTKDSRLKCRLIIGTGASVHDLFENFLLNTIHMPHYLARFKTAGANDIRMVEHFDVAFLKEIIGVQNKLEGKLLVKFVGKFNEETIKFREWLSKQNVMTAYVNKFESKGIITWGILSDFCPTIESVQRAFRMKNKAHAHFLYTQLERYRNGELSDGDNDDDDLADDDDSSDESDDD